MNPQAPINLYEGHTAASHFLVFPKRRLIQLHSFSIISNPWESLRNPFQLQTAFSKGALNEALFQKKAFKARKRGVINKVAGA